MNAAGMESREINWQEFRTKYLERGEVSLEKLCIYMYFCFKHLNIFLNLCGSNFSFVLNFSNHFDFCFLLSQIMSKCLGNVFLLLLRLSSGNNDHLPRKVKKMQLFPTKGSPFSVQK